jgi:hypothetical protein
MSGNKGGDNVQSSRLKVIESYSVLKCNIEISLYPKVRWGDHNCGAGWGLGASRLVAVNVSILQNTVFGNSAGFSLGIVHNIS